LQDVAKYVREKVEKWAEERGKQQRPEFVPIRDVKNVGTLARVHITTIPPGAKVLVDGEEVKGKVTPLAHDIELGQVQSKRVTIVAKLGDQSAEKEEVIERGRSKQITLTLKDVEPSVIYLANITPLSVNDTPVSGNNPLIYAVGRCNLNGKEYSSSIFMFNHYRGGTVYPASAVYRIPEGNYDFETVVGVDDSCPNKNLKVTFSVRDHQADDKAPSLATQVASWGKPQTIRCPLKGVRFLKLTLLISSVGSGPVNEIWWGAPKLIKKGS
jgi:hypothetical protein